MLAKALITSESSCFANLFALFFQSIREIQNSLRDGVILLRALVDELKKNVESEREGIHSMYNTLQETIKKQCDALLQDLER